MKEEEIVKQAEDEGKCLTNCVPPTAYMVALQKVKFLFLLADEGEKVQLMAYQ